MENLDLNLNVNVNTQNAVTSLDNLGKAAEDVAGKVGDIGQKANETVGKVSGLGNAFEEAFSKMEPGLKGLSKTISETVKGIKAFSPAFKGAQAAGNSLWKSIKVGIASTGLGLLIVLIGELVANWDKWTDAIQKWLPWARKNNEEAEQLKTATNNLIEANKTQNEEIEFQARLMKAQGKNTQEVIKYKIKETQALLTNTQAQLAENRAVLKSLEAHSAFGRWIRGEKKQYEEVKEAVKALEAEETNLNKTIVNLNKDLIINVEETKRSGSTSKKAAKENAKEAKSSLDELKQYKNDVLKIMQTLAQNKEGKFPKESQDWFSKLLLPASPNATTEKVVAQLQSAFNAINKTIKKEEDKLKITYEAYLGLLAGDAEGYTQELNERISKRHLMFATGRTTLEEDLREELEIQKQAYENEEVLLTKRLEFLEKTGHAIVEVVKEGDIEYKKIIKAGPEYEEILSQLTVLSDEMIAYTKEQSRKIASAVLEGQMDAIQEQIGGMQDRMDRNWFYFPIKGSKEIYNEQLKAQQTYYAQMRDSYDEGTAEYEEYSKKYQEITDRLNGFDGKRTQFVFQQINEQYKKWQELISSIGSLFGSLADIYEEDIKAKRERNEISEEEAEKEFERVKKLQLAEVWINTLSGAIGAFLQASAAYPAPWGQILGAATAATVLASGIAQHKKIQNTKYGDTGGGGGVNTPNVGVTPLEVTDDIQASPSVLQDSQTPKDQRVYILEGDIQESNKRVEVRETNTTF